MNWIFTVDLKDIWEKAQDREISQQNLVRQMIPRIEALRDKVKQKALVFPKGDKLKQKFDDGVEDLENILDELHLIDDEDTTDEQVNYVMDLLYDFGDTRLGNARMCWISVVI